MISRIHRLRWLLPALVMSLTAGCGSSDNAKGSSNSLVLDPTQSHYGHTADEWGTLWFKYIFELAQTDAKNCIIPYSDPNGANCTYGQSGDVFFFAGTQGGAVVRDQCVVPAGKAILVPIVNAEGDNVGVAPQSDMALMTYVKSQLDGVTDMSFNIDGTALSNLSSYLTQATKFTYTEPMEPNFYTCNAVTGITGPVSPAYAAGYYVLLKPPTVGAHTLHFAANSPKSMPAFMVDVTYKFKVQ